MPNRIGGHQRGEVHPYDGGRDRYVRDLGDHWLGVITVRYGARPPTL